MDIADVFSGDAFKMTSLTASINKMPHVPGRVGEMGLFTPVPVDTTDIEIEMIDGVLNLIPFSKRGGPATQSKPEKATVRIFKVPRLALEDHINADEIQNVRQFGSTDQRQGFQTKLNAKMARMVPKHDATLEFGRLGALKGIIYDADNTTVLYNLFTEFGVTQQTVDMAWATATIKRQIKAMEIKRKIESKLGASTYKRIRVLCSPTFWDKLISDADVRDAYNKQQDAPSSILREDMRYDGFWFGGIWWEEYRGKIGSVDFITDGEAVAFPEGVVDLFLTHFAPGDWNETVNTMGLPRYAQVYLDPRGKGATLETQSNPLSINTRPETSIRLFSSN